MAGEEPAAAAPEPAAEPEEKPDEEKVTTDSPGENDGEEQRYRDTVRDPLGGAGGLGVGAAASRLRSGRAFFHNENVLSLDSTIVNQVTVSGAGPAQLVAGRVPADELERRCRLYDQVANFDAMAERLTATRIVALCGEPSSGRLTTGVVLLRRAIRADIAEAGDEEPDGPRVIRLEPDTDLAQLPADKLEQRAGYLIEPVAPADRAPLTDLHLDRLSGILAERGSYAVVLLAGDSEQTPVLRGRYGMRCLPPPSAGVLRRQLAELLAAETEETRATVLGWATADDVTEALGIGDLRPGEAVQLAGLLVRHQREDLDRAALLASCREFAATQVAGWFRPIDGRLDWHTSVAAARTAAFRIALAVYDGSSYAVVAEAAELLGRRLAGLLDPEEPVTLPLFADDPTSRMLAARAVRERGTEDVGRSSVPVERIRYAGPLLAPAVLAHVWSAHHGVRGPIVRWLQELSRSSRPQVWIPAAQACGLLAQLDFSYAVGELIVPLATDDQPQARLVAATALHGAAADERVAGAVNDLVRGWGRSGIQWLAWTAAAAYALGRVGRSVPTALREIARIGSGADAELTVFAGWSAVQLLGTDRPGDVLAEVSAWARDERPERNLLGLLTALRLAAARTDEVVAADEWTGGAPAGSPLRASDRAYPLTLTLAEANEEWAAMTAVLIWEAMGPPKSGQVVEGAVKSWIRVAVESADAEDALVRFLPRLVRSPGDANILWNVIDDLVRDPDEPLPLPLARRLARAVRGAAA